MLLIVLFGTLFLETSESKHFFVNFYECSSDAQVSVLFGNAVQAKNCAEWSNWGPCIWVKGKKPRWSKSYFEQLLPGRSGCRHHIFYRLLQDRWGQVSEF